MSNTPQVRFAGFTGDWEQRKLIDVCDYVDYRGKTPTKTDEGIFLVTAKNIKDGYIDYEASKEYISEDDYEEVMHRGKPQIGDVLFTTEAPCGNVAQVNREDIALAQRIIKYCGHYKVIDNTYLKYYFLSPEFQGVLSAKSTGGTVQGIKGSVLHQQKISFPSFEEQERIGTFLEILANRITLHQRKCDALQKFKKSMLQKMFPQNGESVPEIRFAGFTEAWEQRELGNTKTIFTDGNYGESYPKATDMTDSQQGVPFLTGGNLKDGKLDITGASYITKEKHKELTSGHLIEDDIVIAVRGSLGALGYVNKENSDWNINSQLAILRTDKNELSGKYLLQYLLSNIGQKELIRRQTGTALKQLPIGSIKDVEVPVAPMDEQTKIGDFFANLDNLITLHQRKLETLQKMKKSLLQKMFV